MSARNITDDVPGVEVDTGGVGLDLDGGRGVEVGETRGEEGVGAVRHFVYDFRRMKEGREWRDERRREEDDDRWIDQ